MNVCQNGYMTNFDAFTPAPPQKKNTSTIKIVLEIAVALIVAFIVFQIIGGLLMWVIRLLLSLVVFGGIVAVLHWLFFGRRRGTW